MPDREPSEGAPATALDNDTLAHGNTDSVCEVINKALHAKEMPERSNLALEFSWRIFPPPTAGPRRTKKKLQKKQLQASNQGDIRSTTHETKEDDHHKKLPEKGKELWRQKQQQYQYTYPYKVGEIIRILVPQRKIEERATRDEGEPKKKIRKLSMDDITENTEQNIKSRETNINTNQTNHLVPDFAKVEKIVQKEGEGRETWLQIKRLSDDRSITLYPKEQRKLLCPKLDLECHPVTNRNVCTVVLVEETLPFRHITRLHLDNRNHPNRDRVLEIGCSTGELSKLIWRNHLEDSRPKAGQDGGPTWIGMDHSQEMIDRCREQLDQHLSANPCARSYAAKVVKVDALEEPKRAAKESTTPSELFGPSPTVVLIDIGGNRECGPVVKTIKWVFDTFQSSNDLRMVIVKSRALVRQLQQDTKETKDGEANSPRLDVATGMVSRGTEWFNATHERLLQAKKNRFEQRFKHPLKAPKVLSPMDGTTPICRYHNYHKDGCKLFNDRETLGTTCPLDHDYCHSCLQKGHIAKNCPNVETLSCY